MITSSDPEASMQGERTRTSTWRRWRRAGPAFAMALALNTPLIACIPIFVSPDTEAEIQATDMAPADHRVTLFSPVISSDLLNRLNEEIEKELVGAENVDSTEFWRTVFPEGKDRISLQELLGSTLLSCAEPLCIDYLVYVATEAGPSESWGSLFYGETTLRGNYHVGIVDLERSGAITNVQAVAHGKGEHAWLPVPVVGFFIFGKSAPDLSDLDEEVVQVLTSRIAAEIAPSAKGDRLRLVLLDAHIRDQRDDDPSSLEAERDDHLSN